MKAKTTPGPWRVMGDPILKDQHEFHQSRYVVTADAAVELLRSSDEWGTWNLTNGSIVCKVTDGNTKGDAKLLAAAPEMLAVLVKTREAIQYALKAIFKGESASPLLFDALADIEKIIDQAP